MDSQRPFRAFEHEKLLLTLLKLPLQEGSPLPPQNMWSTPGHCYILGAALLQIATTCSGRPQQALQRGSHKIQRIDLASKLQAPTLTALCSSAAGHKDGCRCNETQLHTTKRKGLHGTTELHTSWLRHEIQQANHPHVTTSSITQSQHGGKERSCQPSKPTFLHPPRPVPARGALQV